MARVRGTDLVDAQAFVRETYGPESAAAVLALLDAEARGIFEVKLRETAWYPLAALVSYLKQARTRLDPEAPDFYRRQGAYAAQHRRKGPLGVMVSSAQLRMRLVKTAWRMFYDAGRVEVVGRTPETATARIHDFPATPELCERFLGIWEGLSDDPARARAEELKCVRRGDPYCEIRVSYRQ